MWNERVLIQWLNMWLSVCMMSFFGWRHIFSQLLQTYFARKWVIPNSGRDCHAWIKRILASMRLIWATFWWASRIRAEIWQKQNRTHYTHDFFFFFFLLNVFFYLLPPFKVFTNRHTNDCKQMHPTHHTLTTQCTNLTHTQSVNKLWLTPQSFQSRVSITSERSQWMSTTYS